jgi:transcriptional regulator with XRE-family HTH domain
MRVTWVDDLPERILRARLRHQHTQVEAAEHLGTSRHSIGRWENGLGQPSRARLLQLERYVGSRLLRQEVAEHNEP